MEAQSLSVKRAEVEFHNFASMGEPERAISAYAEENDRRRGLIVKHRSFIGAMSPFLEIGANAGHTSYMLANEFGADGFALDLSADALRYGGVLQERWKLARTPVRIAGDALRLPFRDGSLRMVVAFQMLSQFLDIEEVFREVKRVLAPGGIFLFSEEPLRRLLTLRLYRCPYYDTMKPWERKLHEWGLLGYLVQDVIGAAQEESFGIRQNHTMTLRRWRRLVEKHFVESRYEIFVRQQGWGERLVKNLAVRMDPYRSVWRAAQLLGGTFAAVCRKEGEAPEAPSHGRGSESFEHFETLLECPDCRDALETQADNVLACACGFRARSEDGVFNLLPSAVRRELYPGDRDDIIDFCRPNHERLLLDGWGELEGVFGNKYRWIGARASARLVPVDRGPKRLRMRGFASAASFAQGRRARIAVRVNGRAAGQWRLERPGLFVLEADVPEAAEYRVEIEASPACSMPPDDRELTVNFSMLMLIPRN